VRREESAVQSFADVLERLGSGGSHILVGNGFSIACDPILRYGRLYEAAVRAGLSERAQKLFNRLGTSNFEAVLSLLENADWAARVYGIPEDATRGMRDDAEIVKRTLVEAVTSSHLAHVGCVPDEKYEAARAFLQPFHNIFATNYDLLPYWTVLSSGEPTHQDGFRSNDEDPEAAYVVFSER
jgi:hypothetical protein